MTDVHDAAGEGAGAPAVANRESTAERRGPAGSGTLTVTQIRSGHGTKPKTRGTLRALGLGRIGRSNTLPDRPEIRGMIARVPHLVRVSESNVSSESTRSNASFRGEDPVRPEAAPAASRAEEES
jgi:large subunit ribosomal protein L30